MKRIVLCILLLLTAGCLAACGGKKEAKELDAGSVESTTLLVKEDGLVQSSIVEDFDKDYYDKEELKSFLEDQIKAYTGENGADSVKLKGIEQKDKKIAAVFEYKNIEAYAGFNEMDCKISSMQDADGAGILEGDFVDAEGPKTEKEEITDNTEYQVLSIEGQTRIQTEGTIEYLSGAELEDEHTAKVSGAAVIIYEE